MTSCMCGKYGCILSINVGTIRIDKGIYRKKLSSYVTEYEF